MARQTTSTRHQRPQRKFRQHLRRAHGLEFRAARSVISSPPATPTMSFPSTCRPANTRPKPPGPPSPTPWTSAIPATSFASSRSSTKNSRPSNPSSAAPASPTKRPSSTILDLYTTSPLPARSPWRSRLSRTSTLPRSPSRRQRHLPRDRPSGEILRRRRTPHRQPIPLPENVKTLLNRQKHSVRITPDYAQLKEYLLS